MATFSVNRLKDLTTIIIPHFEKYLLLTQKAADFILFKKIVQLMNNRAHLNKEGLQEIINIRTSMNLGLSLIQKAEFNQNQILVERSRIETKEIPDSFWFTGFVEAEGCFEVKIYKSKTHKTGYQVSLRFSISQHQRDIKLMDLIKNYLECGKIYKHSSLPAVELRIVKFDNLINIIILFFNAHPILGIKQLNYQDFCQVADLMKESLQSRLTQEGFAKIQIIKNEY
jgi:hypothetical protein